MNQRISVINKSSGKFSLETINGRAHLVTAMIAIEGDSVMNQIFYPDSVVSAAAPQLDMMPAPDGHPVVDGKLTSAFNPLAVNAGNFGGFTRAPVMDGKQVRADLVIDIDVANRSKRGKKIMAKIRNGERIGVSTGLVAKVNDAAGNVGPKRFNNTVERITFDHVAVLLDTPPAGENTFTVNHGEIKPKKSKGYLMDTLELDLSNLAVEDRVLLSQMTVNELLKHVKHEITTEEAKAIVTAGGLKVNSLDEGDVADYIANKDAFTAFNAANQAKKDEVVEFIVSNSKMEKEQLQDMDIGALDALSKSIKPANTYIAPTTNAAKGLVLLDDEKLKVEA